jgi:3-oxoacyl-[acyl-carrier protein] reductase
MAVLSGKAAVVTGGSRGIGRAVVERLARDGARVVFGYATNVEAAADVERAVAAAGGRAHAVRADLAVPGGVAALFAESDKHLDGLDILVNNAAPAIVPAELGEMTDEQFDLMMTVNARAAFEALRHASRHMRDGGRVVNVSTLNTLAPGAGLAAYCASKGALEQLTMVAAIELGPRGITVNTVSPGATDTDLLRDSNSAEGLEMAARMTPLRRLGEPTDIADVIAFLAGPDGRWMTGQNLLATGGLRF